MPASLYRPSITVFWPLDCRESGYAFGWCNNNQRVQSIVVTGVVQILTLAVDLEVRAVLQRLNDKRQQHACLADLGELKVLGRCGFGYRGRSDLVAPELELVDIREATEYNIVYYHRHPASSLRFYSLDAPNLGVDAFNDIVTPMSRQRSGINQDVVKQLNVASIINTAVLKPSSTSSVLNVTHSSSTINRITKTITAQMSILLFKALSMSQSTFSRPAQSICNAHVLSKFLLKDMSLSVQQMDVRVEQLAILLRQMAALRFRKEGGRVEIYSKEYTSFFNTVWLILNDITIGYAFGKFLCENHEVLATMLKGFIEDILILWPQRALCWLDSWPAGLKLNTELSSFYSGTFVDLVNVWGGVLRHIIFPYLSNTIYVFGLVSSYGALIGGMGGMTMSIALFYDMFVFFTLHIYVCYVIAVVAFEKALWGLGSLWRLFRGKRFNVLRNRTDSWEYDIDQLLFGTILFTLLAFLFPTVLAYYALFALLRLSMILTQASLEIQLAFMNHFPLFALVLRLKDPWRIPGGMYFDFVEVIVHADANEVASAGEDESSSNEASRRSRRQFENTKDPVTTLIPVMKFGH
ncbi:N-acetylglucosaminyl transferase component-domain-containing protein [Lentinula aff. lateritia]|uniref:N-acetylglucosaminyl transferase component-domain-containing protein n=1 Tax=Lentinula aff. lateritia TaxID=2804960 RepID=A0ACC1TR93_9AGAR|nr:N-acetylglucosaminyl transferase component-domain-containing protein [Lentinula aff. lateritia]